MTVVIISSLGILLLGIVQVKCQGVGLPPPSPSCGQPAIRCEGFCESRGMGGSPLRPQEMPWLALIEVQPPGNREKYYCTGSLVHPLVILTSIKCMMNKGWIDGTHSKVFIGGVSTNLTFRSTMLECPAEDVLGLNENTLGALILDRPVPYSAEALPICLDEDMSTQWDSGNFEAVVAGYERMMMDERGGIKIGSPLLRSINVKIAEKAECQSMYPGANMTLGLCAGIQGTHHPCLGDHRGNPLVVKSGPNNWVQIGISVPTASSPQTPGECLKSPAPLYISTAPLRHWIKRFISRAEEAYERPRAIGCTEFSYAQSGHDASRLREIGADRAGENEFPFLVSLAAFGPDPETGSIRDYPFCGGSLIANNYVLTAGHCIDDFNGDYQRVKVRVGAYNLCKSPERVMNIDRVMYHPNYNKALLDNDIALVKLVGQVNLEERNPKIGRVDLSQLNDYPIGMNVTVCGWGKARPRDHTGTTEPHKITIALQPPSYCSDRELQQTENQLCAGNVELKTTTCIGDSGSPVLRRRQDGSMEQIGIVSTSLQDCSPPDIFTKIHQRYRDWISTMMRL